MERISLYARTESKKGGKIKVRFRLNDGRNVQLFHKSSITATEDELKKFKPDGTLKQRAGLYNRPLFEAITNEIALVRAAYKEMLEKQASISSETLEEYIARISNPDESFLAPIDKTFIKRFIEYVDRGYNDGIFGLSRYKHDRGTIRKLERFLAINRKSNMTYEEWDEKLIMQFREFVRDEYLMIDKHPGIYRGLNKRDIPKDRRSPNSVANEMQVLEAFFNELEDTEEILRSPFRKISKERRKNLTRKKYDDPVFLRKAELLAIQNHKTSKTLLETQEAFILHCAIGCRIGDFQKMTMDNISVSEDGIPYIHYLPEKTRDSQNDNKEVQTPLVRFAYDIIMRTKLEMPILKYPSGKSGYNKKIKKLLEEVGIERKVPVFDAEQGTNNYIPLYEAASSKLARKTHIDMMNKVQVNLYAAGLHKKGSDAVNRYTKLELTDKFALLNAAFDQEDYRVDDKLNII